MKRMLAVMTIICLSVPGLAAAQGYEGLFAAPATQQQYKPPEPPKGGYSGVISWEEKPAGYGTAPPPPADNLYDYIQDAGDPASRDQRLQAKAVEQQRQRAEAAKAERLRNEEERRAKAQAAIDKVNADNQQLLDNTQQQVQQWQQPQGGQQHYGR